MKQIRCAPHIHSKDSTTKIMVSVIVALLPALFGSLYFFGLGVLKVVGICIISCLLSELLSKKMFGKELRINDGSAILTGLLLAFTLPPNIPLWIAAFGSFVAIFLTKELFGGIGFNIFNTALTARALLLTSFHVQMT